METAEVDQSDSSRQIQLWKKNFQLPLNVDLSINDSVW